MNIKHVYSGWSPAATLVAVVILGAVNGFAQPYIPEEGSAELSGNSREQRPAKVDSNLPNVLIIGDSISIGYTGVVSSKLAGKANVIHNPGNGEGTKLGLEKLQEWLGDTKWDVIHFNWGLHDLKHVKADTGKSSNDPNDPRQSELETYTANLETLVKQLKSTGAKLIFATTTPFPAGVKPCRFPEDAVRYNAAALGVMRANDIQVNDLYHLVLPKLNALQKRRNVHFNQEGSKVLGEQVADVIQAALGEPPARADKAERGSMQATGQRISANSDKELHKQIAPRTKHGSQPQPHTQWTYRISGGRELQLDVFLPAGYEESAGPFPALVFFHGGSWREGDPSNHYADCAHWAKRGMVAVSAEYRLKDENTKVPIECMKDAKSAVRFLRANAEKLKINPNKIVVAGDSAGGQLAASTATVTRPESGHPDDPEVSCRPDVLILSSPYWVTGCSPEDTPTNFIVPGLPPTIAFLGDSDTAIRIDFLMDFHERLKKAGNASELHIGIGGKHGFINGRNPANKFFPWALGLQEVFLVKHGILPDAPAKMELPPGVPELREGVDFISHR